MDSKDQTKVLLIEDDEDDYILTREYMAEIKTASYHLDWVASYSAGLESIEKAQYDVYLVDYRLGERDGLDLLREAISRGCNAPIIILTGQGDHEVDVAAMSAGAADYLVKGQINAQVLERTIRYAIERKQAEEALRVSEERYRMLFNSMIDGFALHEIICDQNGTPCDYRFLETNPAFEKMTGLKATEIIGKTALEVLPDTEAYWIDTYGQVALTGNSARFENYSQALGKYFEVMAFSPRKNYFATVFIDITERKQAEEEIKKLSSAVEQTADIMFITNRKGIIEYVNPAFEQLTGYAKEDAIGKTPRILNSGQHTPAEFKKIWETILAGKIYRGVVINRKKSDELFYEEKTISPLRDSQGEITHCISTGKDITEQMRAQESLQASEQRYRSLFDGVPVGLYRVSVQGEFLDANPALVKMLGFPDHEALLSTNIEDLYENIEDRYQLLASLNEEGVLRNYRSRLCRRNGEVIWVEGNTLGIRDNDGQIVQLEGSLEDITQQVQANRALRQRDAILEAVSFASGGFLRSADWQKGVQDVLSHLGKGAEACRAYIFENHTDSQGILLTSQRYEWAAPEITPQSDNLSLHNFPLKTEGFARWEETLSQGKVIQGHVRQLPESEQEILSAQEIQSILIVPIFVGEVWWGFIGYDACVSEREWSPIVVDALKTAADTLGAAIQRTQAEEHIQTQLQRLDGLRQIDQAITGSMELKITLNVVIEQVTEQLRVDAADILLYQPFIQTLEYAAGRGFRTSALQRTNLRLGDGYAGQAALERRTIRVRNINEAINGLERAPLLPDEGFLSYFGVPLIAKGELKGVMEIFHREDLEPEAEWLNYLETLGGQAAIAIDNATLFRDLQNSNMEITLAYDSTLEGWAKALDLRDHETEGHSRRVVELTLKIARAMGMREDELVHARRGALLHDIGKMGVPDQILQKPGPLDEKEWEIMRQHPVYAYQWLSPIQYLNKVLDIPYCHHEKWDGSGYPQGLQGERIPLAARLFAIVDVWDALNSDRPYRDAWPEEKILAYFQEQSGRHFDPRVVEAFLDLLADKSYSELV